MGLSKRDKQKIDMAQKSRRAAITPKAVKKIRKAQAKKKKS